MKIHTYLCCFAVVVSVLLTTPLHANNNLFLPGDAFFPTILTQKDVEALQQMKSGKKTFSYSSLGGYEGAFCGYAGYRNAIIPAVDDGFTKNLESVYKEIRRFQNRELIEEVDDDGKIELVETNGIRVLFYPAEFKFPGYILGLRYNENWVEEAMKFGHRRSGLRLCSLIDDPNAVQLSWRDAPIVPSFDTELPDVELKPTPSVEEPVVFKGDVKAIVIGSDSLTEIFRAKPSDDFEIYIVDSNGFSLWEYWEGEWSKVTSE